MANMIQIKKLYKDNGVSKAAERLLSGCQILKWEVAALDFGYDRLLFSNDYVLWGPPSYEHIVEAERALLRDARLGSLPSNAIRALEVIISFPKMAKFYEARICLDALRWAWRYFAFPILSAVVKRDKNGTVRLHMLFLPIVSGKMIDPLSPDSRAEMESDFEREVGCPYAVSSNEVSNDAARYRATKNAFSILAKQSGVQEDLLIDVMKPHYEDPFVLLKIGTE